MGLAPVCITLTAAYIIGSIPTALLVSKKIRHIDIRSIGDGNMGARNTFHTIGPKFGVMVAAIDFTKGTIPVVLAGILGLGLGWQILAGIFAILGHDFPVWAGFRGGQGTATSLGTMLALFPLPALTGLGIYGLFFLIIRNSNVSCGIGGATIALYLGITQQWTLLVYAVAVFLFIPVKLFIDSPRRRNIAIIRKTII
jgi:glycerol-3-phosphate acyltransferase PlsY